MPFEKLHGIVLRYVNYRDNDRIFTVFTRERGTVSLTARGIRSKKAAFENGVKDVFCCGEFVTYERHGIEYISSSASLESFYPICENYDKFVVAAYIVKFVEKTADRNKNDELFSLLYYILSFLAYGKAMPEDLLIGFIAKFIVCEGYEPIITCCANCGKSVLNYKTIRFSNGFGGSVCNDCASNEPSYSAMSMEALRRILLLENSDMDRIRLTDEMRRELRELLFKHVEYCLGQKVMPNSY